MPGRPCRRRPGGPGPRLASARQDTSVSDPAQAGPRGAARTETEELVADLCRFRAPPVATRHRAASPGSPSASADGTSQDSISWSRPRPLRADSSVSRSARKRSTTRLDRASSSRLSPTMRPASAVASAPTSARSEVTACWRSASICALPCSMIRADSTCACSRISTTIWAPCSRASSRIRAASCRASPRRCSSSANRASASACLASADAIPPSIASVRSAKVFSKLGTTYFLIAR